MYERVRQRPAPSVAAERTKVPSGRAAPLVRAPAPHGFSLSALPESRDTAAVPIQRKVGFEVEYAVPSYGPAVSAVTLADGKPGSDAGKSLAKTFLFGGIAYKAALGENEHFKITADHNSVVSREPVRAAVAARGKIDPADTVDPDASSNLEYVTPAVDELAKGSDKKLDTMITAVSSHLTDTFVQAQAADMSVLKTPAAKVATGSAANALEAWLPDDDFTVVKPSLETFRGKIADECYLQATVGVLPSAMRTLFKTDTAEGGIFHQGGAIPELYEATNAVGAAVEAALRELDYVKKLVTDKKLMSVRALSGLAHLLSSYLVGEVASQTSAFPGGTIKNAVPFLIKVDPKSLVDAATIELNLFNIVPDEVITAIASAIQGRAEITVQYWLDKGYEARVRAVDDKVTVGTVRNLTLLFLRGEKPTLSGVQTGGEQLKKHDSMPGIETDFQAGVPLEYRFIAERPKATALKPALLTIVEQARALNLSQFPEDKQEAIRDRVKT